MAETPSRPHLTDAALERALIELGEQIDYPAATGIAAAVRHRLLAESADRAAPGRGIGRRELTRLRRVVALIALGLALLAGAVLALSPAARTAVARWLSLRGIVIVTSPGRPILVSPVATHLHLGQDVSLAAGRRRVSFGILLPRAGGLGPPDEVYVDTSTVGRSVALVWRVRPGLPRTRVAGVGMLLMEFRAKPGGYPLVAKTLEPGTQVQIVTVAGSQGFWLSGAPHYFGSIAANGAFVLQKVHLAGNVLLWMHGDVTMRLESALSQSAALHIADSM